MMQIRNLLTLSLVATLGISACTCSKSKPNKSTDTLGGTTAKVEEASTQEECTRWTGQASEPVSPVRGAAAPVTASLDLDSKVGKSILQELQAELDANMPQFASCGLRADGLRSVRFVITHAGVKQGRIVGLPPLAKLLECPLVPNLVAMAKAKGWIIEDGGDGELLVRQEGASALPSKALDFATPEGHWLHVSANAGPSDARVKATLRDDPEHVLLLQLDGPAKAVDAADAWCKRVLERQQSVGVAMIGSCQRKGPTTIQFIPAEVEPQNAMALAMTARSELFETSNINGSSMLPGVHDGDVVFVDKSHDRQVPPRGSVVVFQTADGSNLIKRIVGLPGEKLEIVDEAIRINGKEFRAEPTVDSEAAAACGVRLRQMRLGGEDFEYFEGPSTKTKAVQIPDGHVYVLGDNRAVSKDSRTLGPIPIKDIDGVGAFIAWSTLDSGIDWTRSATPLD